MFWVLLRARVRMIRNGAKGTTANQRWIIGLLSLGGLLLFSGIGIGCAAFVRILEATAPGKDGLGDLSAALLGHVYEYLFFFLLAGSVPFVASSLFQDADLPLLLTTPVSPTAVVGAKMIDATVSNSAQFVILGVPVLLGLAWGAGVTGPGWLVFAAGVLLMMLVTPALAAFLLLLMARLIGIRRIRFIVMMVSIALALSITMLAVSGANKVTKQQQTLSITHIRQALTGDIPRGEAVHEMRLAAAVKGAVDARVPSWLPSTWASTAMLEIAKGKSPDAVAEQALAEIAVTWLVLLGLCVAAGRAVVTSEDVLDQRDLEHTHRGIKGRGGVPFPGLSAAATGIILKDLRYIGRDTIIVGQIGTTLILFFVPFVLKLTDQGTLKADFDMYANLAKMMVVLIAYMITSIVGLSSVGLEGRGAWMLFASPVAGRTLLGAKWTVSFVVSLAIALFLCLVNAIAFHWSLDSLMRGVIVVVGACFALSGIGVGLSGLFPRFLFDNPAQRASVWAMLLGFVLASAYMIITACGFVVVLLLVHNGIAPTTVMAGAWVSYILLTLFFGLVPIRLAHQKLTAYQWEG